MIWLILLLLGTAAGVLGGMIGFGSSILLMPALVLAFGPKEAVPIMAMAAVLANLSRAALWWRDIDWRVNAVYCATAIPAAVLGASLLISLDVRLVETVLGVFLIAMVPIRRWISAHGIRMSLAGMAIVGAGIGLLTGLVATTGPLNTPFFLAYGLTRGAFLATEAIGAAAISLTKLATFRTLGALPVELLARGVLIGGALMLGSWVAKRIVLRMDPSRFTVLVEGAMIAAGLSMLASAVTG